MSFSEKNKHNSACIATNKQNIEKFNDLMDDIEC